MITVAVYINGKAIIARSARNVGADKQQPDMTRYHTDADDMVLHHRPDGAISLAIKLLQTVKEP